MFSSVALKVVLVLLCLPWTNSFGNRRAALSISTSRASRPHQRHVSTDAVSTQRHRNVRASNGRNSLALSSSSSSSGGSSSELSGVVEEEPFDKPELYRQLDRNFLQVTVPAFFALLADPLASIVDAMYIGRLGAAEQAALGIAISAQFSVAKLYNDPLLKTSTSLVANKEGEELSTSVSAAIITAITIGIIQTLVFTFFGSPILAVMGVRASSEMKAPALSYLKYRALGIPASTLLIVSTGIFRGRGDTKTPLFCSILGNLVNITLDPVLIFKLGMGCSGAGLATSISQWVTAVPLMYLLNRASPIIIRGRKPEFYREAAASYIRAGGLIMLRTVAKIGAYTVTSSAAARLGTVSMAAYSLTFNLGFATSQLCESISIAAQSLLAKNYPFNTKKRKASAAHVIRRAVLLGAIVSGGLSIVTRYNQQGVISKLSSSPEVREAALSIMPVVLVTQLFKGLAYSSGGIILGGLDWYWSSLSMQLSAVACVGLVFLLPKTLWNIWVALAAFMATQVIVAAYRMTSNKGPWTDLKIFYKSQNSQASSQ